MYQQKHHVQEKLRQVTAWFLIFGLIVLNVLMLSNKMLKQTMNSGKLINRSVFYQSNYFDEQFILFDEKNKFIF